MHEDDDASRRGFRQLLHGQADGCAHELAVGTEDAIAKLKQERASKGDLAFLNKLLIRKDSARKGAFDIVMLVVSVYNIYGNAYYSAFDIPFQTSLWFIVFDNSIELLFFVDMICCFCQEYVDEETYTAVSDIKMIAINYLKRSFIFDLLAVIPFESIFLNYLETPRLWRLMKLLRMPRLSQLLDVEKFKNIVNAYY